MFNKKKSGYQPPKYRKPTPPPPPTSGSNAVKPKQPCAYETPCGWCTKWDKKCDKKIGCGDDTKPISCGHENYGEWISVEDIDKWPSNPKTRVLCCKGNGIPFVGRQFYKANDKFYCRTTKNNKKPLSHWCYLPTKPAK